MIKRRLPLIIFLFFLFSVSIFLTAFVLNSQRTSFFSSANSGPSDNSVSSENSYVFASPLQAQAQNLEKVRITVFVLNGQGLGIPGLNVSIVSVAGISVTEVQPTTDAYGKAIFDISAVSPGDYIISAQVGSTVLPQSVTVSFN